MKNKFNNFTIQADETIEGDFTPLTPEMKKAAAQALENEKTLAEIQAAAKTQTSASKGGLTAKLKTAKDMAKDLPIPSEAGNKYFLIIAALAIVAGVYWFYFRKK